MKFLRFSPVQPTNPSQPALTRRSAHLARSIAFAVVLCGSAVLGSAVAHAEGPKASCSRATETTVECLSLEITGEVGASYEGGGEKGGFSPADLRSAYKLPTTGGSGQTVAIVDAFNDPNAESDLKTYRSHYGLSECTAANGCFKKVNQKGETTNYPANESGWSVEMSLDLDMVSAVCPECHITLVEATSNSFENMSAAEDEAAKLGTEISDSWGGGDSSARVAEDSHYSHSGIPILVSAGDYGYGVEFPATVPTVISVGGTSLKKAEGSRGWSEKVWYESGRGIGTGSGCSLYQSKPSWQTDSGCTKRTDNDVAAVGACESPLSIYDSYEREGWFDECGTSASAPILAGVEGLSSKSVREMGAEAFWKAGPQGKFFDVTEGSNGSCGSSYLCTAKTGYDGPTGWGTPNGVITLSPPENTALPVASPETPDQAVPESTTNGAWKNEPTNYTYQWRRCNALGESCTNISGATSSTYTPVEADVEHTLVIKVTATNSEGSTAASSKATNKVEPIGHVTEYTLPTKESWPWGITEGPDGNMWFTENGIAKIAKITTSGTVTSYSLPAESSPVGITAGSDGKLWFTDQSRNKVGKITTSGTITEYSTPAESSPFGITAGPDGNLWFTDLVTSKVGKITTSGTITEYSPAANTNPFGIAVGPDGNLWFTQCSQSGVSKITTSGTITEYALPREGSPFGANPQGIAAGPDGNLWFAEAAPGNIGKITTSGTLTEYSLPKESYPTAIAAGPDGNLWFTEESRSKIGRITTSGTITEYSLPEGSNPHGIAVGPDKNMWFTDRYTNKVGKITP